MLTDDQITKFQTLYKKRFGKEISKEVALEQGVKLVRLMSLIYKPIAREEYEAIQKRREQKSDESSQKHAD